MNNTNPRSTGMERCPYLGLHDDSSTSLAYASTWNYCYRAAPPASILVSHQAETCLCPGYVDCAVYQANKWRPLPSRLRGKAGVGVQNSRSSGKLNGPVLLFLLAALVILVLFLSRYAPLAVESGGVFSIRATSTGLASEQPLNPSKPTSANWTDAITAAAANSSTEGPGLIPDGQNTNLVSTRIALTSVSVQTSNPLSTAALRTTETLTLTSTPVGTCGHALDVPFGGDIQLVIQRVARGENLTLYAEQYHTSIDAILAVNYHLPMPVWEDWIIVIPIETIDVSEIPLFEPYQAIGTSLSLGDLAQELNTDPQSLYKYNAFAGPCKVFSGWLIIPRKAKTP